MKIYMITIDNNSVNNILLHDKYRKSMVSAVSAARLYIENLDIYFDGDKLTFFLVHDESTTTCLYI